MGFSEDLDLMEHSIRTLKIEWEKFFGGVEKKPPNDAKNKLEALIRKYAFGEIRQNADRFRYQMLTARYNTFNELWTKRLRAIEEGRPLGVHGVKADILPPPKPAPPPERGHGRPGAPKEVRVQDPSADGEAVRLLYEGFLEARRATGETAAVKFDSFQKLISQQAARILTEKGAKAVDFRLETKEGKVSLKAKPVK